jgi:hypothetical protein
MSRRLLAPSRVDLSEQSGFFLDLLDQTRLWRERLVQEIQFASWTHVRLVSSYQIDFPPDLLSRYVNLRRTDKANVLLPLTTREKAPLLNFALSGPGGIPAALTSRASTAALQAQYLELLAQTSSAASTLRSHIAGSLYEAIGAFTPGLFRDTFLKNAGGDHEEALQTYLQSGLGTPVASADLRRWQVDTAEAAAVLANRLNEPPSPFSCSEELLLALPKIDPLPQSIGEVDAIVRGYLTGVKGADKANDDDYLTALAEYGRRYEMIVEVEVPLLEPSTIKIEEDLPLELSDRSWRSQNWMSHTFAFGDARSVHLEARSLDPSVEIAGYELRDVEGGDATGWVESVRHARETLIVYSSEPERPYYVSLRLRLRSARHLQVTTTMLAVANLAALVGVLLIENGRSYVDRLAVLVIPTTVAATFVLIREQTALATRLQWRGSRAFLAATTLVLWIVVVVGLIRYDDTAPMVEKQRPKDQGQLEPLGEAPSTI